MQLEPYLFFNGRCEEALDFYRRTLGGEVTALMRFRDAPDPDAAPPGGADKVMHANMRIGEATIMASDGDCAGQPNFQGFSLTLAVADVAEAERLFTALSDGGEVRMALAETFWSPRFGMLTDRFGLSWMINVVG